MNVPEREQPHGNDDSAWLDPISATGFISVLEMTEAEKKRARKKRLLGFR